MSKNNNDIFKRIETELKQDRHWRAKEILQSRAANNYNLEEYKLLGDILIEMKDYKLAGMYLFLSGSEEQSYRPHIDLFLEGFTKGNVIGRVNQFPRSAKNLELTDYPNATKYALESLDYSKPKVNEPSGNSFFSYGCMAIFFLTIGLIVYFAVRGIIASF